jgi:response regulator NasT
MLRVLVVDESPERAEVLRLGLERAGHRVVATVSTAMHLLEQVQRLAPDVIIIDTESPTRDVIEHLCVVSRNEPRPIVMFCSEDDTQTIREAVRAGVTAYVVDGLEAGRVKPIVDVAVARFEEFQRLKMELAEVSRKLTERRAVERAKGLLMKSRGLTEEAAYAALRSAAMRRGRRIGEIAADLLDAAELLG